MLRTSQAETKGTSTNQGTTLFPEVGPEVVLCCFGWWRWMTTGARVRPLTLVHGLRCPWQQCNVLEYWCQRSLRAPCPNWQSGDVNQGREMQVLTRQLGAFDAAVVAVERIGDER